MPARRKPVESPTVSSTVALQEREVRSEIMAVVSGMLKSGLDASAVTGMQVKALLNIFSKWPSLFQSAFEALTDRVLALEAEEVYLNNIFRLFDRLF